MKEIVFKIAAGGNRMTDTNEKNKDVNQNDQATDILLQETLNAESRIGEMPRRNHKDSTFCLLFSEPARAIELYNAVTGENLPPHFRQRQHYHIPSGQEPLSRSFL